MANPWDEVKKSPATLALEAKTAKLRKEGLPKDPPAKKVGEIGITEAYGDREMDLAGKLAKRNKRVADRTRLLRRD
jgi:hypothetical protein